MAVRKNMEDGSRKDAVVHLLVRPQLGLILEIGCLLVTQDTDKGKMRFWVLAFLGASLSGSRRMNMRLHDLLRTLMRIMACICRIIRGGAWVAQIS